MRNGTPVFVKIMALLLATSPLGAAADEPVVFGARMFHASEIEFGSGQGHRSLASADEQASALPSSAADDGEARSDAPEGLPEACQLWYRIGLKKEVHCSGSLVAARVVLTAAHCLESEDGLPPMTPISVGCGYTGQDTSGRFSFAETFTVENTDRNPNWNSETGADFAFLKLDHPSQFTPLSLPESFTRFQEDFLQPSASAPNQFEFNPAIDCRFSGFGYDPRLKRERFKTSDESPRNGLKGIMDDSTLMIDGYGASVGDLYQGDAGGPLYCRKDEASPWVLVAVASGKADHNANLSAWSTVVSRKFLSSWSRLRDGG